MKKTYLLFILTGLFYFMHIAKIDAQIDPKQKTPASSQLIEGLKVTPNPVSGNVVYITSKENKSKIVSIYNILGEQVMYEVLIGKELNISRLPAGLYVLKCVEANSSATLKLIKN